MCALLGGGPPNLLAALLLAGGVPGVDVVALGLHGSGALHLHLEDLLTSELLDSADGRRGGAGAGAGSTAGEIVVEGGVAEEEVVVGEEGGGTLAVLTVEGAPARPGGEGAGSVVRVQVAGLDVHGRRGEG